MPAGAADWSEVRRLWESGLTAYAIEKEIGGKVTRQAIAKKAKRDGWRHGGGSLVPTGGSQAVPGGGNTEPPEPSELVAHWAPAVYERLKGLEKDSASLRGLQTALNAYALGGTHRMAAAFAGVSEKTWITWREDCPLLADAILEIQAAQASRHLKRIDAAGSRGDWKADEALLKANPHTRDDWKGTEGKQGGVKIEIVFGANMPPEAMRVIEGD